MLLADELVERPRPETNRKWRVLRLPVLRGLGEEVSHGAKYAPAVAPHSDPGPEPEDYSQPVLEGGAPSDYERYLNTEGLLALQKGPEEWVHRDELLFQVTHQSSELWLKLAWNDIDAATAHLGDGEVEPALRLLRRSALCLVFATNQLDMLEQMSPWEYQEIRKVLGHGSGFDSPGWNALRHVFPRLGLSLIHI